MRNTPLACLLLTAALLPGCHREDQAPQSALPPTRAVAAEGGPRVPSPPPRPDKDAGAGDAASAANRYVATALPREGVQLGPKMSGTLAAVLVDEGDRVKKGQVVFRVDASGAHLGVSRASAALQGAVIQRDNARRELDRQRQLAESGSISAAVLERAEAAFTAADNGLEQAQVAVSLARRSSSDSVVVSPIDGVVTRRLKSAGETATMTPPTTVLEIQDQSAIELRARIPEGALRVVHPGDRITAHFTALEVARAATIVRVQPTVDAQTRTIEIVAEVDNADGSLRPGMYVEVDLMPPAPPPADASVLAANEPPVVGAARRRPLSAKERP